MSGLILQTLRDPDAVLRQLQTRLPSMGERWMLLALASILSAILAHLALYVLPAVPGQEGMLMALSRAPLTLSMVQFAAAALGAVLLSGVGRMFGGRGRFPDALLAVGWAEIVMFVLQGGQLALTAILPPLGALAGLAVLGLGIYLIVAMTMAVHGFRNAFLVVLGIVGTIFVTGFLMSTAAAMLGLLSEVPA